MRRIVLDMKGGLLAEAVMQALTGCDPDFVVYRSLKPEETVSLCRACGKGFFDLKSEIEQSE